MPQLMDMSGVDADSRREGIAITEAITQKIRARTGDAELDRLSARLTALSEDSELQRAAHYGNDYPVVKKAEKVAEEAMRRWHDAHDAEVKAMLRRAPLVERRGFLGMS